jgi:hypothetical protein
VSDERDLLIEATTIARRERDGRGRLIAPPAWHDLPPDAREAAFDAQTRTRDLERAVDARGYSGTVRAVLERIEAS